MPDSHLIYHYTDANGLLGIIEKNCLWATDHRYLNDRNEVKFFTEWLARRLGHISPSLLYQNLPNCGIYFTSFCGDKKGDLLSQWRGYSKDGGYAVGFDHEKLDDFFKTQPLEGTNYFFRLFDPVIYSGIDDSVEEVKASLENKEDLNKLDKVIQNLQKCIDEKSTDAFSKAVYVDLFEYMIRFKHDGFREEKEYRLAVGTMNNNTTKEEIFFRNSNGGLIPYIKFLNKKATDFIKKIVIGPSFDIDLRKKSLRLFLGQHGLNIEICKSDIPYIGG